MGKIKKVELYIGLNDKDTKRQEIATLECVKIIKRVVMSYVEGCTVYQAEGIYKHIDDTFTIEQTIKVEMFEVSDEQVDKICEQLATTLNQEQIIAQETETTTRVIEQMKKEERRK